MPRHRARDAACRPRPATSQRRAPSEPLTVPCRVVAVEIRQRRDGSDRLDDGRLSDVVGAHEHAVVSEPQVGVRDAAKTGDGQSRNAQCNTSAVNSRRCIDRLTERKRGTADGFREFRNQFARPELLPSGASFDNISQWQYGSSRHTRGRCQRRNISRERWTS